MLWRGYAEVFLIQYEFKEKADKIEFYELALCILLNSAACFSQLKVVERIGQVCSLILDFQHNNVKAMYRRAMAAIELGRHQWAYWDLMLVAELNPNNQEVIERLEEVKSLIFRNKSISQTQADFPKGLGMRLPPHKKSNDNLKKEHTIVEEESHGMIPVKIEEEGGGKEKEKGCLSPMDFMNYEECSYSSENNFSVSMEKDKNEINDKEMEDIEGIHLSFELSSTNTDEGDTMSSVCNDKQNKSSDVEKPIYRFHN